MSFKSKHLLQLHQKTHHETHHEMIINENIKLKQELKDIENKLKKIKNK